ncbi:hypothetical protein P152DRAFT_462534 [Eremomyces bilateralis CBS 781.70]|uniref:Uncharacterized protein n=1 Tax=Eremomyces bilateralis CBS 781.70 TaxID=1392243 RepID=A0A6G1FRV3_9PEZI|nr:uncharacterized protein P152DRAFT_462534 [Eremomyces bilateralis CBS 781.70]KAF1808402.1 hypothetical protein P152DRAFT_462534 [Eremomyces bilateralis CBS 781.70]
MEHSEEQGVDPFTSQTLCASNFGWTAINGNRSPPPSGPPQSYAPVDPVDINVHAVKKRKGKQDAYKFQPKRSRAVSGKATANNRASGYSPTALPPELMNGSPLQQFAAPALSETTLSRLQNFRYPDPADHATPQSDFNGNVSTQTSTIQSQLIPAIPIVNRAEYPNAEQIHSINEQGSQQPSQHLDRPSDYSDAIDVQDCHPSTDEYGDVLLDDDDLVPIDVYAESMKKHTPSTTKSAKPLMTPVATEQVPSSDANSRPGPEPSSTISRDPYDFNFDDLDDLSPLTTDTTPEKSNPTNGGILSHDPDPHQPIPQAILTSAPNLPIPLFARPRFPPPVRDRSPIIGITNATRLHVCFRIGEALNTGCAAARNGQDVLIELYARVAWSTRDESAGKQHFELYDAWHDRPPHLQGVHELWNQSRGWEKECGEFLEERRTTERGLKLCRCVGKIRRDLVMNQWVLQMLNVRVALWEEVEYMRGVVCI